MKFIYPAVFRPTENGSYEGYFPDLADCVSRGQTLEEVIENAHEAALNWLSLELSEDEPVLPLVSEPEDIPVSENEVVRNICVTIRFSDGWDE